MRIIASSLIAIAAVLPEQSIAQQWTGASAPYGRHINDCLVLSDGRMVVVGGNPVNDAICSAFTSGSSGLYWDINYDVMAPWLWSVDFDGNQNGVAVGNEGTVLRTDNGGTVWIPQTSGTVRHLRGVAFRDSETVFAVGGQTGATPMQTIVRSDDGGESWTTVIDQTGPMLSAITFTDAQTGVAVGISGTVLRTVNGGADWNPVVTPELRDLNAITFIDGNLGFAVGGRAANDSIRTIWSTDDGGVSWQVVMDTPGGWLRDIDFLDGQTGYAVGAESTVLMTTDGGVNWSPVLIPDPDVEVSFNAVDIAATDLVLVAGQFGTINVLHDLVAPQVETLPPSVTSTTSAILRGEVLSSAGGTYRFLFGTQPDLSDAGETPISSFNGAVEPQPFSFTVPNLTPDATYYYAAVANTLGGSSIGEPVPVTMTLQPPVATTGHAVVESQFSLRLTGTVNTSGLEGQVSFRYSSDPQLADAMESMVTVLTSVDEQHFQAWVQMPPGDTLYYSLRVTTVAGTAYGDTVALSADFPTVLIDSISGGDSGNMTFYGRVEGLQGDADVHFSHQQYPDDPVLVDATPESISGSGMHLLVGSTSSTLPMGIYQARLHVVTELHVYESYTASFNVGQVYTQFEITDVQYDVLSEMATFSAQVAGLVFPANLFFSYGNGFNGGQVDADPAVIEDDGAYQLTASVMLPADNTHYYLTLMAQTESGWIHSEPFNFTAGISESQLQVLTADSITDVSALLRGSVGQFSSGVEVSFQFGPTPALGTTLEASPSIIAPNSATQVSATLDGLQPDTYYYYSLTAEVGDLVFHTDTRQFYTGEPPIPNWNFSQWEQRTVQLPMGWSILERSFEKVDLGGGNSALHIFGYNVALLGRFWSSDDGPPDFHPTVGLAYRPDSLHVVMEWHVEPEEMAVIILRLDSADVTLHYGTHPITGSSEGAFEEFVLPIEYTGAGTPDSVTIGFLTFDALSDDEDEDYDPGAGNNHLTIDRVHFGQTAPEVAHSQMTEWFDYSYAEPQGWSFIKFVDIQGQNDPLMGSLYTYGAFGDTALALSNHLAESYDENAWVETGTETMNEDFRYFEVDRVHEVLTGYYMFHQGGQDTLQISVSYYGADGQERSHSYFRTAVHTQEMARFELPIEPFWSAPVVPEKAYISIEIRNRNGASPNSWTAVDRLCFDGFYVGTQPEVVDTTGIAEGLHHTRLLSVHPNPSTYGFVVNGIDTRDGGATVELIDLNGQVIMRRTLAQGVTRAEFTDAELPSGIYQLLATSMHGIQTGRAVIMK